MRLTAYLYVPDTEVEYVRTLWDQGDESGLREYADNKGYWEIEGLKP